MGAAQCALLAALACLLIAAGLRSLPAPLPTVDRLGERSG
ncbi:hypothetical protein SAMN05444920_101186 [Nonomuraea solani]|uniref:Uncharacterized protein n=1 Tax=Nonomuraea solani TaxID=1144553 RepID=A0A1H5TD81_9ACTN|nr:hypothetical protein SAMN05444920_101186 [Nonomuraea solani]